MDIGEAVMSFFWVVSLSVDGSRPPSNTTQLSSVVTSHQKPAWPVEVFSRNTQRYTYTEPID